MNLAEFPLGTLSDRPATGQSTLVFEDRIFDEGRGERVTRRLTITAAEKYGLPTALDDEVLLGLIQLTRTQRFLERRVDFTRYQLLELLGWRDEGRSYQRLDTSLRRWLGVTLYYDKAWWDKAANTWVDESFHVLDQVTVRRRDRPNGPLGKAAGMSCFTWNEVVFRSFQAGYLKQLDWATFRSLKLPTTKRMYRFLDKRFHHKSRWEFKLGTFAFEHIGLARSYDTGQVKRKLLPAVRELEGVKFLEPLPTEQRFVRKGKGDWRIVMQRRRSARSQKQTAEQEVAVGQLTDRGVTAGVARQLVSSHSPVFIQRQVRDFDALLRRGNSGALRNPPGFLVATIKREGSQSPLERNVSPPTVQSPPPAPPPSQHDLAIGRWEQLTQAEQQAIAQLALQDAGAFLRANYEQARARGQATLAGHYLAGIVACYLNKTAAAARSE